MRLPRMTTRRWMIAVAAVAILAASCVQVQKWWRLRTQYDAALRDYASSEKRYDDERLAPWDLVGASQRLMEAELGLATWREHQVLAVTAHVDRVSRMIDEESKDRGLALHDFPARDAYIIEEALRESKSKWETWIVAPEAEVALEECKVKLDRLKAM